MHALQSLIFYCLNQTNFNGSLTTVFSLNFSSAGKGAYKQLQAVVSVTLSSKFNWLLPDNHLQLASTNC